jgi:hypothetical protein
VVIGVLSSAYLPGAAVSNSARDVDEGRNEGSTPRSFVLPATPAVALIQEAKTERKQREKVIKICMLNLIDEGFYVRNIDDIHDDQIPISVIRFQIRQALETTGKFDLVTREALSC